MSLPRDTPEYDAQTRTLRETDRMDAARAAYTCRQARHWLRRWLRRLGLLCCLAVGMAAGWWLAERPSLLTASVFGAVGLLVLKRLTRVPEDR